MEPISIRIKRVLGVRFGYRYSVLGCEREAGIVPGAPFHTNKIDIEGVSVMAEKGVGEFMEERALGCRGGIRDGTD